MVEYMAYQNRQSRIRGRVNEDKWSQADAEEEWPGHVELVQEMCRNLMMLMDENEKPAPMDCMFEAARGKSSRQPYNGGPLANVSYPESHRDWIPFCMVKQGAIRVNSK